MKFGNWKILEQLGKGKGGNGIVFRVINEKTQKIGALKLLQKRHYSNKQRIQRFIDEIISMLECRDIEGVLSLIDYYIPEKPSNSNQIWFVSELAIPMADKLGENYTLQLLIDACISFASTLTKMHEKDISHRDIKPDNLFFKDGKWFIGDFGLVAYPEKLDITKVGERIGPLFYMSPEMLLDAKNSNGKQADVWSLAKLIWKYGTGLNYPIEGTLRQDISATRLSTYNTNKKAYLLEPILEIATSIEPNERISMHQMMKELISWREQPLARKIEPQKLNLNSLKGKISGMFLDAKKESSERKKKMNNKPTLAKTGEELISLINNEILENIDNQIKETGLVHAFYKTNEKFHIYSEPFHLSGLPRIKNAYEGWIGGAGSIIYPPVLEHNHSNEFQYGIGVYINDTIKAEIVSGIWHVKSNRNHPNNKMVTELWIKKENVIVGSPRTKEILDEIIIDMERNFVVSLDKFTEIIKDNQLPRGIIT